MITLDDVLQVTFGLSSCGVAAALAFKLLRIMTRYNVLLTGQSLDELDHNVPPDPAKVAPAEPFRYRLRIQSLEATRTEYPIEVTIQGFPDGTGSPSHDHHVWAVAGWKSINVIRNFGAVKATPDKGPKELAASSELFTWQAIFPELPALDAWSFDVVMPCQRLDISIRFVGAEKSKLITPTFGPYFEPERLTVYATDRGEPRIQGSVTMPRPVVPVVLSVLTLFSYVLLRALKHWRIDFSLLTPLDAFLLGGALIFIWIGYASIRRPVYPVISGYRFITPPWPESGTNTPISTG